MGYTNYWHQHRDFTKIEWGQIKEEYDYIKEVCENIIVDETQDGTHIVFNGLKKNDQDHETFVIKKNARPYNDQSYKGEDISFNFCKTAMKPYDLAVWNMLTFINRICPNFPISRDR